VRHFWEIGARVATDKATLFSQPEMAAKLGSQPRNALELNDPYRNRVGSFGLLYEIFSTRILFNTYSK